MLELKILHLQAKILFDQHIFCEEKFQNWFGEVLQTKGQDILRSKGILNFDGEDDRYVFQGVHMLMDASPMGKWPDDKERSSRLVFIGRNLETMNLKEGFEACKSERQLI